MTDAELIRRAEAAGISASYLDWRKQRVQVPQRTLEAILAALGVRAGADDSISGSAHLAEHYAVTAPVRPALPASRSWGFTIQLYSVRSAKSWGHGDLRDLADLAAWSARELGAGFVLVNPLHAAEPGPPLSNSPYLPMTRRYVSPLYLRIEDIAEFERLSPDAAQGSRQAGRTAAGRQQEVRADRPQPGLGREVPGAQAHLVDRADRRARGKLHRVRPPRRFRAGRLVELVRAGRAARRRLPPLAGRAGRSGPGPRPRAWSGRSPNEPGSTPGCSGWPMSSSPGRSRWRSRPG